MIKKTYIINSSIENVWQALIDPRIIKIWTGSLVKMSAKDGEKFSLWDNSIWGKNIEVKKEKLLVQECMEVNGKNLLL